MVWINTRSIQNLQDSKQWFTVKRKEYIAAFLEPFFSLGLTVISNVNNGTENILINFAGDAKLRGTELTFKIVLTRNMLFKKK